MPNTTLQYDIHTQLIPKHQKIIEDVRITRKQNLPDKTHKYGTYGVTRLTVTIANNLPENVKLIAHNLYKKETLDRPSTTIIYDKEDVSSDYARYKAMPATNDCNHCRVNRFRNSIFYGIDTSTDTPVQYGSDCVNEYMSKDDLNRIDKFENIEIASAKDPVIPDKWFLKHAVTIVLDNLYNLDKETEDSLERKLANQYPDVVARLAYIGGPETLIDNPYALREKINNAKRILAIQKAKAEPRKNTPPPQHLRVIAPIIPPVKFIEEVEPPVQRVKFIEEVETPKPKDEWQMPDDHPANPKLCWAKIRAGVWK